MNSQLTLISDPGIVSRNDALFRAVFTEAGIGIAILDSTGSAIEINPVLEHMLSKKRIGSFLSLLPGGEHGIAPLLDKQVKGLNFEHKLHRDFWVHVTVTPLLDEDGEIVHMIGIVQDITAQKRSESAIRDAEKRFRSIFENALEGIFQTTADGHYLAANPALAKIYGYTSAEELMNGLTNIASQLYVDPNRREEFVKALSEHDVVQNFESQVYRKDGQVIWISENCRAVRNSTGEFLYFEGMVEDITERKRSQDQLIHDALHDTLTGLPNRALFEDRLRHAMKRRDREQSEYSVMFIDCDRFKLINDSLGHLAGDEVLIEMSRRITQCLREGDTLARLGGDEFVVLVEDISPVETSTHVAERIQASLAEPFVLVGQDYYLTISIGICNGSPHYKEPGDLLRDADTAMYEAKSQGRDRHVVFEAGMHLSAVNQLQLGNDLRRAIENGNELFVVYQPIYNLPEKTLAGFEALVRWQHPTGEVIYPDKFISLAEENGLIHPLGKFVLETAVAQMLIWDKAYSKSHANFISVNLSPAQLHRPDIVAELVGVVDTVGFPADRVRLEITESGIMNNPNSAKIKMDALKARGFKLAIDDFGTGYSSLAHLHRFPVDTLKVDRSFIAPMLHGGDHMEIVRTILALGHNLGMSVVAEGVETHEHNEILKSMDCGFGQGWHYSKALPCEEIVALLVD